MTEVCHQLPVHVLHDSTVISVTVEPLIKDTPEMRTPCLAISTVIEKCDKKIP